MELSTINSSKTEDHHNKILSHNDNPTLPTMQLQRSKGGLVTMPFIIGTYGHTFCFNLSFAIT